MIASIQTNKKEKKNSNKLESHENPWVHLPEKRAAKIPSSARDG
jgi:hypothetical protein